ncbi:N-acetyl-D-Glu racemase DgcA [uncultured Sphingomonas sp.]|uniref:N-acetyl-D-Glu racemase DgcA n=1 Tax=uncultured Sphingomonas sp. TaxID=158754 RepID=UPI002627B5B3|nr:N-acetyl-D-Glu racemase DgcA [uncultured Sphingomonas sp.]
MLRTVRSSIENWPLKAPFRIARGVRTASALVTVEVGEGGVIGRGEGVPSARYGEDVASVTAQIEAVAGAIGEGATRDELRALLPAGSARCALDCALWDMEIRLGRATLDPLHPITTALTVSIDTPEGMAAAARKLGDAALVKVKVNGEQPEACLRAVRAEVPNATLIVDANESWTMAQVERLQPVLAELRIAMLEQPLPAGADDALHGFAALVPICADESCHVTADLDRLRTRYSMVNIKLDKTGGLTEALDLLAGARTMGLGVMVGCMVGTSLSMAPAFHVAQQADFADLDGPWLMREDRPGGLAFAADGRVTPPVAGFWGTTRATPPGA